MEGRKQGSEALKKMIPQLLISVSLFSFLLSYSSLLHINSSSSFSPSPKFHHYYLLNKNSLFLICYSLLIFLAKTSGFIQPPAALDRYVLEKDGGKIAAADGGPKEVSIFIAESEEERGAEAAAPNSPQHVDEDHESPTACWLFEDDGEHLYGQEGDGDDRGEDEDEDEDGDKTEEEEEEMMKTEELNRKFEDFIRKMKEEITVNEARQKVVMLN